MAQQKFTCSLVVAMLAVMVVVVGQVNCDLMPGFERCDNSSAVIHWFFIDACSEGVEESPCQLRRDSTVVFALDFSTRTDFDLLYSHMGVEHQSYTTNACDHGIKCPVRANQRQSLVQKMVIDENLETRESDTMEFFLTGRSSERVICIKFPVAIV